MVSPSRTFGLLGMLAAVTVLVGCSSPAPVPVSSGTGKTIAVSGQPSSAAEQALFTGTAVWGDGGCMYAESDDGATFLIVFPHGTTLDEGDTVRLPDGYVIAAGHEIKLGGGFHAGSTDDEDLAKVPAACITEEVFWASGETAE